MKPPRPLIPLLFLALALALASAASAKPESARFRVSVSGSLFSHFKMDRTDICGNEKGQATELIHFHQSRRVPVEFEKDFAQGFLGARVPSTSSRGIPITGDITRAVHIDFTSSGRCIGTYDPTATMPTPPKPDCGKKPFHGWLIPNWSNPQHYPLNPEPKTPVLWFYELQLQPDPFVRCGSYMPLVLMQLNHATLMLKQVLGHKAGITLSTDEDRVVGPDHLGQGRTADTTVRWTAHLKRVR